MLSVADGGKSNLVLLSSLEQWQEKMACEKAMGILGGGTEAVGGGCDDGGNLTNTLY